MKNADINRQKIANFGLVMAVTRRWATRPEVLPLFEHYTLGTDQFFARHARVALITFIAATQVPLHLLQPCLCPTLAKTSGRPSSAIFPDAGLGARDVALLAYAEQVTHDVAKITENYTRLRGGFPT